MKKVIYAFLALVALMVVALVGNPMTALQFAGVVLTIVPIIGTSSQSALKEAREKANKLAHDMRSLNEKAVTEKRDMTSDESSQWDKMDTDLTATEKEIRRLERMVEIESRQAEFIDRNSQDNKRSNDEERELRSKAFRSWLMGGERALTDEYRQVMTEMRDLSLTDNAGGYTVPEGFMNMLEVAMKDFGGIYASAGKFPTATGNDVPYPTMNDTANKGAIIGENTTVGNSVDPTFGAVTFKAFTYSSKPILVSNILLQDTAFNLEQYLANAMAERVMRALAEHLATGNGSTQPHGLVTAAANASLTGVAAAAITFDNLIDLLHSVDPNYRKNGSWVFNDNTLKALRKIKDGEQRPIWQGNYTENSPATILGRPYVVSAEIADIGASAKSILFGDLSKFMVREVSGGIVKRLVERYADLNQTGFLLFKRFDSRLINAGTNPVKYLVHAAT